MPEVPATLDAVFTELWFLLGGMGVLFVLFGWIAVDMQTGRRRIYEKVDTAVDKIRVEIKSQGDTQAAALRNHEDGCNKRAEEDARWKGRIEGKLGIGDGED